MVEVIELNVRDMPDDEAIALVMEILDMSIQQAMMYVAVAKGESTGDVVNSEG